MCRSMEDIQSPTAEIRRGKKKKERWKDNKHSGKIECPHLLCRAAITMPVLDTETSSSHRTRLVVGVVIVVAVVILVLYVLCVSFEVRPKFKSI